MRELHWTVAIALGSNLGDRRAHLEYAIARLREHLDNLRVSRFLETDPVGVDEPQPAYLNGVVTGGTTLSVRQLLHVLLAIERERGRVRTTRNAPRTLDLDLILYGDAVIDEPDLVVPHPRFRERRFVLGPLAEIAPDVQDPVTGQSIAQLRDAISRPT